MSIEKIKSISNENVNSFDYLKESKLPLVLYGAGKYASMIKDYLDNRHIEINYVAVGKDYYKSNDFFYDFPIKTIDKIISDQSKVNIVFAYNGCRNEMALLSSCENISKMCFIDICSYKEFEKDFIETHYSLLEALYFRMEDELSKVLLIAFINSKKTQCSDALYQCNVKDEKQYFPSFLHLIKNEVFVDCGAYDGDTSLSFTELMDNNYRKKGGGSVEYKIYAFECDRVNIEKLRKNTDYLKNMEIIEKGCWAKKCTLSFSNDSNSGSKIDTMGKTHIDVDSIDNIVQDEVSFIKMDIEGSELEALKGAKNTIKKYKPKLAISVYHKQEDLVTIPQYILSLNEDYRLYLRHYGEISDETILYAV